jgi:hypothetical protein
MEFPCDFSASRSLGAHVDVLGTSDIVSSFMLKTEIALQISIMNFNVGMKLLIFSWQ